MYINYAKINITYALDIYGKSCVTNEIYNLAQTSTEDSNFNAGLLYEIVFVCVQ